MTSRIADADQNRLVFAFSKASSLQWCQSRAYWNEYGDFSAINLLGLLLFDMGSSFFRVLAMTFNLEQNEEWQ
ncbi:hypothetical protein BATR1942_18420 [Bacillus atrophaeus 1942]|uniref:Uncharacterized protein n=1 Tax=Bacillus atrophaeus (strain 1942) TaxID=720555 RepID=A0ABM5M3C5_BACA1|nr:hypothetical protein BATR1942_18420 [Bacillus atrophaeus 1942]